MFTKTRKKLDKSRGVCYNTVGISAHAGVPAGVFPTSVILNGAREPQIRSEAVAFLVPCVQGSQNIFSFLGVYTKHEGR
jgi:hypothetical protein